MSDALKEMLGSKKWLAALVGVLTMLLGEKLGLTADQRQQVMYFLLAAIAGQSVADFGKSAAQINAKS